MCDELKEKYDAVVFQINREDELMSKRLTWSLSINGFLFAAIGLISRSVEPQAEVIPLLYCAVPWVGMLVSAAAFLGVIAGTLQIRYLKTEYSNLQNVPWVRPFGGRYAFFLGWAPSLAPPAVLSVVWGAVLYKMYC